jgi:hypothetical protein
VEIDEGFGHWLAGFTDGEGSFLIGKNGNGTMFCSFRIALHHKDEPILREISERTGIGRVWTQRAPSMKAPTAMWTVSNKAGCLALVELFEAFPLRAKKARDFAIWARAVRLWSTLRPSGNQYTGMVRIDYSGLNSLRHELRAGRPNRGPKVVIP